MQIVIRDLDRTRIRYEAMIQKVGEGTANLAFSRAMNHEGAKITTAVRRALRQQTGLKAGIIQRATKRYRASRQHLVYVISSTGDHFGLSHFNPKQFKFGTRAKPWNRVQRFPHAFVSKKLHNNVFVRSGKARLPIQKLWGPSIPKEMVKDASLEAFEKNSGKIMDRAMHELTRILRA